MADAARILCWICGDPKDKLSVAQFPVCLHTCCSNCMVQYIRTRIGEGRKPKCPSNCGTQMTTIEQLQSFVPDLVPVFKEMLDLETIPARQHCALLLNLSVSRPASDAIQCFFPKLHCSSCGDFSCQSCVSKWHESVTCDQFKATLAPPMPDSIDLSRCPNCRHGVLRTSGCIHITCRCGFEFCYSCEAPYVNHFPSCNCAVAMDGDPELVQHEENVVVGAEEQPPQNVFFFDEDWLN